MTSERDEFRPRIKEVLAKRAGQRCSNPNCRAVTSGPHDDEAKAVNLGVAAHIAAAASGGPRYNPHMSPKDRAAIGNAIWLCRTCATLVDVDTKRFPQELLIMWKRRHEESVKAQTAGVRRSDASTLSPGQLNVSGVYPHYPADGHSCILDFRVSNQGGSDLLINAVELRVLESLRNMPLGQAPYSAQYDLDISALKEFSSQSECQVAQILKPGEVDRFAIVLSAPSLGLFAGWRLATEFETNFGATAGPEVEVWLPRPKILRSFRSVTQRFVSHAEAHIEAGRSGFPEGGARSVPGKSAGYETFIVLGIGIFWYYGPRPLVEDSEFPPDFPVPLPE